MSLLTMILKMSEGLGKTCAIFFLTLLFSLPLGMLGDLFLYQLKAEPGKLSELVQTKWVTGDSSFCPGHFPLREGL